MSGDKDFFEDPDRNKVEIVYSPGYCSQTHWTNQLKDDFDPYREMASDTSGYEIK